MLRYHTEASDDGLPAGEGVFLACSFWMVDALHGAGRVQQARTLFGKLLDLRNDGGLLSEEWDPTKGRQLGNTRRPSVTSPWLSAPYNCTRAAPTAAINPSTHPDGRPDGCVDQTALAQKRW